MSKNVSKEMVPGRVSVIVPVYNGEKYLHKCLQSLATQTYSNLEIICINDGSTDRSLDMLQFFANKDVRFKIINQKKSGPSAARNAGLDAATGEYISFVDSDDFLSYNAYEILTEVATHNEVDMIIFGGNIVPYNPSMQWAQDILDTKYRYYTNYDGCKLVFEEKATRPFLWLHFIKRRIFEEPTKLRFNENMNLGEDQLLQFNYVPRTKNVMVIEDKLYNYRVDHSTSLMSMYGSRRIKKVRCHFEVIENVIKDWRKQGYYESNKDGIASWLVNFMYYTIVDLPDVFRRRYAREVLDIVDGNGLDIYINEYERWCYDEFKKFAVSDRDEYAYIQELNAKIENEKMQIQETLKSRSFKMARKLIKKKDRLDLSRYSM